MDDRHEQTMEERVIKFIQQNWPFAIIGLLLGMSGATVRHKIKDRDRSIAAIERIEERVEKIDARLIKMQKMCKPEK